MSTSELWRVDILMQKNHKNDLKYQKQLNFYDLALGKLNVKVDGSKGVVSRKAGASSNKTISIRLTGVLGARFLPGIRGIFWRFYTGSQF